MAQARKTIKEYIEANAGCSESEIMIACDAAALPPGRATICLKRMIRNGRVIKAGDSHSWTS